MRHRVYHRLVVGLSFACACSTPPECEGPSTRTVQSLEEVERLRDVEEICGDLKLLGPSLTGLDALASLEMVRGSLVIAGTTELTDLQGLGDLREVGGHLIIEGTFGLESAVFAELVEVGGELRIASNSDLAGLMLPRLEFVDGGVVVSHNPVLEVADGLGHLRRAPSVVIADNGELSRLSLAAIESVATIAIVENHALEVVEVGPKIDAVEIALIASNSSLTTLGVAANASEIGVLSIIDNDALTEIADYDRVQMIGGVWMGRNASLHTLPNFGAAGITELSSVALENNDSLVNLAGLPGPTIEAVVINNDNLDPEHAIQVVGQTAVFTKIDGNLGQPVPHVDECPWEGDVACDQPTSSAGFEGTGLCVSDSDCDG